MTKTLAEVIETVVSGTCSEIVAHELGYYGVLSIDFQTFMLITDTSKIELGTEFQVLVDETFGISAGIATVISESNDSLQLHIRFNAEHAHCTKTSQVLVTLPQTTLSSNKQLSVYHTLLPYSDEIPLILGLVTAAPAETLRLLSKHVEENFKSDQRELSTSRLNRLQDRAIHALERRNLHGVDPDLSVYINEAKSLKNQTELPAFLQKLIQHQHEAKKVLEIFEQLEVEVLERVLTYLRYEVTEDSIVCHVDLSHPMIQKISEVLAKELTTSTIEETLAYAKRFLILRPELELSFNPFFESINAYGPNRATELLRHTAYTSMKTTVLSANVDGRQLGFCSNLPKILKRPEIFYDEISTAEILMTTAEDRRKFEEARDAALLRFVEFDDRLELVQAHLALSQNVEDAFRDTAELRLRKETKFGKRI